MTQPAATSASDDDVVERLRPLDVCCVSDALDALGLDGVLEGVRPLWEGARLVGRAVTTKLAAGPAPTGRPPVHLGARAIAASRPGNVIVIDNDGREAMGSWGGLLSAAAALRGVAGVVSDGACRDVDEARELKFPVFGRSPAVRTARGRVHEVSCGEPVSLCGITVRSGDIVFADGSGALVIAAVDADRVADRAEQIARRERAMQDDLRAGRSAVDVLGASYEHLLREPTS